MGFTKKRANKLTTKEIDEFFKEHLSYRLTMLTTFKDIRANKPNLSRELKICCAESCIISVRMFIEFLGLGIKYKPLRLIQNRDYYEAKEDYKSYEIKIIDLNGKWVDINNSLNKEEKDILAKAYLTGHRATAHLTHNTPFGGDIKSVLKATEIILKLLKSNLYDIAGKEMKCF